MKKHICTIHKVGMATAWIAVEGDPNHQVIAVPKETVVSNDDPSGPHPGTKVRVTLPGWVREVADVWR